ncbi:hypothetical protein IVA95_29115 [Bradyrhizobium sp. 157]|uniref:hypothetical protein n=1 Tax=Bradyrhizobium sp. 157 TaxID=2782631 RepID=UPI001FF786B4|nr:hypothetical protein [Bradyrhizobium sp. 157]MCK1641498.1 hypothetical protein [Bradyrhizobium sp. 157]
MPVPPAQKRALAEQGSVSFAASDGANDVAEIGLSASGPGWRALELLGVTMVLMLDEREIADPRIGLALLMPAFLRSHYLRSGAVEKPGLQTTDA